MEIIGTRGTLDSMRQCPRRCTVWKVGIPRRMKRLANPLKLMAGFFLLFFCPCSIPFLYCTVLLSHRICTHFPVPPIHHTVSLHCMYMWYAGAAHTVLVYRLCLYCCTYCTVLYYTILKKKMVDFELAIYTYIHPYVHPTSILLYSSLPVLR